MSKDPVSHILHEILGMRKLSARWVPRLLTPDNKRNRETTFRAVFDAVSAQSEGVSASFRDRRRNMDPLVHTRDQGTVETVDFTRRTSSEESEDCTIGRKGDGHRFL